MNDQRFSKWDGPGWYAPCQEGRGDNQATVYYRCGYDESEPPGQNETYFRGLGNPIWLELENEID